MPRLLTVIRFPMLIFKLSLVGVELSEDSALSFSNADEMQREVKNAGIVNFPQIDGRPPYSAAPWFASSGKVRDFLLKPNSRLKYFK